MIVRAKSGDIFWNRDYASSSKLLWELSHYHLFQMIWILRKGAVILFWHKADTMMKQYLSNWQQFSHTLAPKIWPTLYVLIEEKSQTTYQFFWNFICEGKVFLKINPALCSVLLSTKDTHRCLAHCHFCTVAGFGRCIFFYRQTNKHRSGGGKNLRWSFQKKDSL